MLQLYCNGKHIKPDYIQVGEFWNDMRAILKRFTYPPAEWHPVASAWKSFVKSCSRRMMMMRKNLQVFQVFLPCVVGQIAPRIFFNIDVPLKDCLEFPKLDPFGPTFCVCFHLQDKGDCGDVYKANWEEGEDLSHLKTEEDEFNWLCLSICSRYKLNPNWIFLTQTFYLPYLFRGKALYPKGSSAPCYNCDVLHLWLRSLLNQRLTTTCQSIETQTVHLWFSARPPFAPLPDQWSVTITIF